MMCSRNCHTQTKWWQLFLVVLLVSLVWTQPVFAADSQSNPDGFCVWNLPVVSWLLPHKKASCDQTSSGTLNESLQATASTKPATNTKPLATSTPVSETAAGTDTNGLQVISQNGENLATSSEALLAGLGIKIKDSVISNTGILSLKAGEGISVAGNKITNTGLLSLTAGDGVAVSGSTVTNLDKGSSQNIFKNILVDGQNTISAGSNTDSFTFAAGSGISLSTDTSTKKLTISNTGSGYSGGALDLPSNGLTVGTNQLVVSNGRVGIGTSTPTVALDVNGSAKLATNSTLTLTSNNPVGTISRLLTLKSTSIYDRPWISNIDYDGRHVVGFGILNTNWDGEVHKRWEFKTVASAGGSQPQEMLTRLAIDYDAELANVIFGRNKSIGVHNWYGERISFVHQMRDPTNATSIQIGEWSSELGANDSTVMGLDPKTMNSTTDATLRMFRETDTSGQRRLVLMRGDGTATESIILNAGTGTITSEANGASILTGDGTNTSSYINLQSNRTMVGYDGSSAVLQAGLNKSLKLNVNTSSFGAGTAMTILSTGNVGIATVTPSSLFSVGSSSQFQVNSSGAIAAATGITSSGTVTLSGLNTAGGVVYTNGSGVLGSVAGSSGQCLISAGTGAPTWGSCTTGGGQMSSALGVVYPTNATDDLAVGGTTLDASIFSIDESTATFGFGLDNSANPTFNFEATDADAGTFGFNSNDAFYFSGANVGINATNPSAALQVGSNAGALAMGDGTNTSSFINFQSNRTMTGYDGSFAVLQGGTSKGIKLNVNNASFGQGTAVTIDSSGNVGIGVTPTLGPLHMASGAYVTSGGTWTNASDKNLKENFTTLNADEVINKINALPITEWNYITEGSQVRHIGPMAQDFYQIFGLGNNNTTISTIDPAGIALLGIQGLDAKVKKLDQNLAALSKAETVSAAAVAVGQTTDLAQLTVTGETELKGGLLARGKAVFESLTTFLAQVTFKGGVKFEKAPEFSNNMAGIAIIKPGADHVIVTFDAAFAQTPQVSATLKGGDNENDVFAQNLQYVVKNISATGFELKLNKPASSEVSFSWLALAVAETKTSVSEGAATPTIEQAPTASPDLATPIPAVAGTESAEMAKETP